VPSIPPEVYDRHYFLSETCEGFAEFREGRGVSTTKAKLVAGLGPKPGLRVLDAGCGRGEVLLACARSGADVAGIDYAEAAVELTRETLTEFPDADVQQGDITSLPWPDASFDRVLFGDVIEHLDPPQTVPALSELRRVLKPGGYLLVHTAPNRLFMSVGWPLSRPVVRLAGHSEVADRLDGWFKLAENYHVNEQSIYSLRRALRKAGFVQRKVWLDSDVLRGGKSHLLEGFEGPLVRCAMGLARVRPVRLFMSNDLYGRGSKP
jgi:ubiquinone/menaquinone biosynthesis C-methylase UbiE